MRKIGWICILLFLVTGSAFSQLSTTVAKELAVKNNCQESFEKAEAAENEGKFDEALMLYQQVKAGYEELGMDKTAEAALTLHRIGRVYANKGNLTESRNYTLQAMNLREKLFGKASEAYINSLNNYALSYYLEENYEEARTHQTKVMELCNRLEVPHPSLGMYTINMGRICYMLNDLPKAAEYFEQALPLVDKFGSEYEFLLNTLGMIYVDLKDEAGMNRIMALTEEHNERELQKPCDEPDCMIERAEYYGMTGESAKAEECYMKALAMPMDDEQKVKTYGAYAKFLAITKRDFANGATYYFMAAQARQASDGKTSDYYTWLFYAATYSYLAEEHSVAIERFEELIAHDRSLTDPESMKRLATCRKYMANAYLAQAVKERKTDKNYNPTPNYEAALAAYRQVLTYHATYTPQKEDYPKAWENVAKVEKYLKHYEAAIEAYKQAMSLYEQMGMADEYTQAAVQVNTLYARTGQEVEVDERQDLQKKAQHAKIDQMIEECKSQLEVTKTYMGELGYATLLKIIAGGYAMKEDYANAVSYYKLYMTAVRDGVRNEFRMQDERQRMLTWNEEKPTLAEMVELMVNLPAESKALLPDLAALAYDGALLSKGILLNSSIEFERILQTYGDKSLKSTYDQTKLHTAEINRLRQSATTDADMERLLALMRENQQLQLDLYKRCAEFADFTDYIAYDWRQVQQQLSAGDVAIEFVALNNEVFDQDNRMIALVLTAEMEKPAYIPVCTLADAKAMAEDQHLFTTDGVLWNTLSDYLKGAKRLFFSADGVFNQLGIEYLSYGGKPLSEQMEVYRLSSTKELCYKRAKAKSNYACLFGDINYTHQGVVNHAEEQALALWRSGGENAERASFGFSPLKNTLREVNEIKVLLQKGRKREVKVYTDSIATERIFRKLTDSKVNILHIATHGYYSSGTGNSDDESMENSALALAGADYGIAGIAKEDSTTGNGLLTAAEVAKMNLRGCDMAVLSACETGLGKLGDDGVFGLQRGFKNAGVHTLLMSLQTVNDAATADLMIAFYRHWMAGASKREALVRAQRELREAGFTDSRYWASFILLDGTY